MGLETVKEEIIRNAKQQEEVLLAEAREKAKQIVYEAERKAAEMKEKSNADTKKIIDVMKKQELASAELEGKKMLLEAKKELIDSVFSEAQKKIEKLDAKKREDYIKKLLEKTKNDIEVANVYCNKNDIKLIKDFEAVPNDMLGGLIAENKDKTIRVDYSFDTLLQNIKENELQSISRILFS